MQTHTRGLAIEIDQAGFGGNGGIDQLRPKIEQDLGDRRPRLARHRMVGLIAIARPIRHPAQGPTIGHAHRKGLSPRRYGREQGRSRDDALDLSHQIALGLGVKPTG